MRAEVGPTAAVVDFALGAPVPLGSGVSREVAIHTLTDSLGVCVAGRGSTVGPVLATFPGTAASGGVGPYGALLLGSLGHALDYDDTVPVVPGHPSVPVLAALVAGLPAGPVSGRRFLEAYIIGVEVSAKIAAAVGVGHYRRGWHSTSTHSCLGATAGLARLHGGDRDTVRAAMGIATSLLGGVQCNFGTMTKPMHSGFAAHHAVLAFQLASAGATANLDALEAEQGYVDVYGTIESDVSRLAASLGDPWVFDDGVFLKRYPCCYAIHRSLAAVDEIRSASRLAATEVERIDIELPVGGLRPLRYGSPDTGLEGKFSIEYGVAAMLLDGDVGLSTFTDEAVRRPAIHDLIGRCHVRETRECCPDDPEGLIGSNGTRGFVRLSVTTTDGRHYASRQDTAPGSLGKRMTEADVSNKFLDCLAWADVDPRDADRLLTSLLKLDGIADARDTIVSVRSMCAPG